MFLFSFLISFISSFSWNNLRNVEDVQTKLKNLTKYSTLYELFNTMELGCTSAIIKKRLREIIVQKKLYDGTKLDDNINSLVYSAYDVMTKQKDTYDFLLNNPYYLTRLLKSTGWINLIFILFFIVTLLLIDFAIAAKRVLTFKRKKKDKRMPPKFTDMKFIQFFYKIKRKFKTA
ncbi:hypothetical protein H312_02543 [Anncaliia algerae PRA339]|uniref:Uncharacterized protein n=1 Tax=Anncaliia algerae PRA339 TaxID=1288291 RepID=A0A059EZB5_9MICR|nr:hypothetical protein H312_02543 [Anncaliia algerae PRA339]